MGSVEQRDCERILLRGRVWTVKTTFRSVLIFYGLLTWMLMFVYKTCGGMGRMLTTICLTARNFSCNFEKDIVGNGFSVAIDFDCFSAVCCSVGQFMFLKVEQNKRKEKAKGVLTKGLRVQV